MSHFFEGLPEKISLVSSILAGALFSQFKSDDSIISRDAKGILQNSEDRKIIDLAVQELKENPSIKNKKLTLSNKEELVISID